jgi:hypothetical protein
MRVIAFIEEHALINKILTRLGLWETRDHDPPQSAEKPIPAFEADLTIDESFSQLALIDYWSQ